MSKLNHPLLRYGFAVASIAVGIWVRLLLDPVLGGHVPYATVFFAVVLTAWYGGLRPAVLAVVLGALATDYFFIPPRGSLLLDGLAEQVGMVVYLMTGVGIALFGGAMHSAKQRADSGAAALREANEQLEARVHDRTAELAHTNEFIRASEVRMAGIINSAMDAIISVDSRQHIVLFNSAAEEMFRCAAAKAMGQPLENFIPQRFRESHQRHVEGFGNSGVTTRSLHSLGVLTALRADGEEFPIEASISKVEVGGEKIFTIILRDIKERNRAKEALQVSELRYRRLFESAKDGILILNADSGQILDVNPFLTSGLGYSKEELVGKELWEIGFFGDVFDSKIAFAELQEKGYIRYEDLPLKTKSGLIKQVEFVSNRYLVNGSHVIQCNIRDISERKLAEEKAQKSEDRYRSLFENMLEGCSYCQMLFENGQPSDFIYLDVNASFEKLTGLKNVVGKKVSEVVPGIRESNPELLKIYGRVALTGKPERFEIYVAALETWFSVAAYGVEKECFVAVFDNITARKQAEAALLERVDLQEQLAQIAATSPGVLYSFRLAPDGSQCFPYASPAIADLFGLQASQLASDAKEVFGRINPEDIENVKASIAESARMFSPWSNEFRFSHPDRGQIWVMASSVPQREPDGSILWRGFAMDITERKRTEADLVRLGTAVEQTADSIVITDSNGDIQYVNPAFERITGYTKEEVLNHNSRVLKSGKTDAAVYQKLWETITGGEVWAGRLTNRKKDGTFFEERVTISPVHDKTERIVNYIAVKQDISDLVHLEDQLRQSQKMEAIGRLAGGVAHDFNNLLTAINGYSSLALQKLNSEHPIRNYLEEIKKAGERAANLTRQLLAFGRKQILQPVALNLNDIVTDTNKMLRRMIGEDVRLTAKLDPALNRIKADPGQIEQVLMNLVVNARDAMPQGGMLTIETANAEFDREYVGKHVGAYPGHYVMLAVSDTGVGMDEETQRRIFEPFFTTKEKGKGTGLGLSMVYGIVKQSGGNIWVYSELGHGTTLKIYLPRAEGQTSQMKTETEAPGPGGSETILLVEDEDVVRGLTRQILEQAGYRVLEASGGEEAITLCSEHLGHIDLLLTDVVMPKTSGKLVAEQVLSQSSETKVLFMSGYTDEAIVHHGVLDSDVKFIQKPFTAAGLSKKVRAVLES